MKALTAITCLLLLAAATKPGSRAQTPDTPREPQKVVGQPIKSDSAGVPTGQISGRVVSDSGRAVSGARVTVKRVGTRSLHIAVTDRLGNFRVRGLPNGQYSVEVASLGYVMREQRSQGVDAPLYPVGSSINLTLTKGAVVTGRVTDSSDKPAVAIGVRATRVRGLEEQSIRVLPFSRESQTDDRGIYRIYGLEPGIYVVSAGGSSQLYTVASYYKLHSPTYYPANARETASEIRLDPGAELGSIDIKHSGERGHIVSGRIVQGLSDTAVSVFLTLSRADSAGPDFFETVSLDTRANGFSVSGVPDGTYNLVARVRSSSVDAFASRRLEVKGRDVAAVDLSLISLGSITGQLRIDSTAGRCTESAIRPETFVVVVVRANTGKEPDLGSPFLSDNSFGVVNTDGRFSLTSLIQGRYRIDARLPAQEWYVKRISLPSVASRSKTIPQSSDDVGQNGLLVQAGEMVKDLILDVDSGAAVLEGWIKAADEKRGKMVRVTLAPAEADQEANVLRYLETTVDGERFELQNLAPGRYFVMAEPFDAHGQNTVSVLRTTWDAKVRSEIRRRAQQTGQVLEVGRCERIKDYEIPLAVTAP